MNSSSFKKIALTKLNGKWGKAICILLANVVINFAISFVSNLIPVIGSIISLVIGVPLNFGLTFAFFRLFYNENVSAFDFLNLGFSNFGRSWGVAFRTALKLIVPAILLIVSYILIAVSVAMSLTSGVINNSSSSSGAFLLVIATILMLASLIWLTVKSYYYSLAQFVAFDYPNLTPKQCVEKSKQLMTGNRGKLFALQFSFIGWFILLSLITSIMSAILPVLSIVALVLVGIGALFLVPYIRMATIAFYDVLVNKDNTEPENTF